MSARVYFIKRVKDCKDVSIMSPQDEQCRRTSLLCLYTSCFTIKYNCMQSKHKQTNSKHSRRKSVDHFTKPKNYIKRRYRNLLSIPMYTGTPCMLNTCAWDK